MFATKYEIKLFLDSPRAPCIDSLVPVFHRIIREGSLGELLIDVINYAHIQNGPGLLLIGHASDYAFSLSGERPGLLVRRKRPPPSHEPYLPGTLRSLLHLAHLLEEEPTLHDWRFDTREIVACINDRLWTRTRPDASHQLRDTLGGLLTSIYDGPPELHSHGQPRERLSVRALAPSALSLDRLLARLDSQHLHHRAA